MVVQIRLPHPTADTTPGVPGRQAGSASSAEEQSIDQAISDGVITAKIRASLTTSPITRRYDIHLETIQGMVSLSGYVESNEARRAALQLACDVEGVQQVTDLLDVHRVG